MTDASISEMRQAVEHAIKILRGQSHVARRRYSNMTQLHIKALEDLREWLRREEAAQRLL